MSCGRDTVVMKRGLHQAQQMSVQKEVFLLGEEGLLAWRRRLFCFENKISLLGKI